MSREDTVICMDNSEWMRNGDYSRTRFEAQYQAIEQVLRMKTQSPENTVGLLSLAGGLNIGVQMLCSPTTERFKVGKAAAGASIGGKADLVTGLRVAQLALKNRSNRQVPARIVLFLGSPMTLSTDALSKLARQLKKSNIAVDVILMGELDTNTEIMRKFVKDVEKRESGVPCTVVVVEPGTYPEDAIRMSQMAAMGGQNEEEDDPMLAMALRESMEMMQAQQQNGTPATSNVSVPGSRVADNLSSAATQGTKDVESALEIEDDLDDDAILEEAKLMSLMGAAGASDSKSGSSDGASALLGKDYFENLLKKAGAGEAVEDPEVKKELRELKEAEKNKSKPAKKEDSKNQKDSKKDGNESPKKPPPKKN